MNISEKSRLTAALLCIGILCTLPAASQYHLDQQIAFAEVTAQPLGDVLQEVGEKNGFYFSYNSRSVAGDSLVSFNGFRGTLMEFLEKTLGPDYEFKETPDYVIIRYAPRTLEVLVETEKESGRSFILKGYVLDSIGGQGIGEASVYDRRALVSTLSNKDGFFRLVIKRPGESVWLTVNKENYREMTMVVLLPVEVKRRAREGKYGYYPDQEGSNRLERTGIGRFLIGSRQRIQRLNLGGFFAYSPYQVSLIPGLSTHGMFSSQVVNRGSMNLVGGYTAGVDGLEMGGVFNINQKDVRFLQMAGVFNLVGGDAGGIQMAGVSNAVLGDVSGIQMGGVSNWTGNVKGTQLAGVVNVAKKAEGLQVAGVLNAAVESRGMQIAGVLNGSSGETGPQIAGVVNIGGKVKGIQLAGLINVADSSDYPIGLINLIKNGRKSFSLGTDESGLAALTFRSGGRVLYGVLGAGYDFQDHELPYALDAGIGAHLADGRTLSLDAEVINRNSTDFGGYGQYRVSFRLLPELRLGTHFSLYAGPSVSYTYPDKKNAGIDKTPGWVLYENESNGRALHIGFSGGLMYRW
ncbi:MAG: hypothetical protein PHI28_11990 [Mangrovibacterium sp.]|nr:hypothetical protein [Mangrovibacterium sp.]